MKRIIQSIHRMFLEPEPQVSYMSLLAEDRLIKRNIAASTTYADLMNCERMITTLEDKHKDIQFATDTIATGLRSRVKRREWQLIIDYSFQMN